jgi:crotonobetainyl-CoA:carnitine CoA-transferase CaiB-like acyl-CoA transferase
VSFLNINRSKRSIALNLKHPRGKALLLDLVKTADVVLQNFRPGVVERLGIGYDDVRAVKPDIVYVSISGFGERGPYAQKPTYDPVVQALSGLTTVQAGGDEERPRLIRTVLPDKLTGITCAQAVTAALLARERSGAGQHVRLSMLDTVLAFLWASDMNGQTYVDRPIHPQRAASFIDLIYETADGHMTVAVMSDKEWAALARALDRPDLIDDPRFKTPKLREENINARLALTQDLLRHHTTADLLARFEAEGVPCAPALTRSEVIDHPQVLASDVLREFDHPVAGRLRQPRTAARFEGTPAEIVRGAPQLGEHAEEILAELGLDAAAVAALRREGVVGDPPADSESSADAAE